MKQALSVRLEGHSSIIWYKLQTTMNQSAVPTAVLTAVLTTAPTGHEQLYSAA